MLSSSQSCSRRAVATDKNGQAYTLRERPSMLKCLPCCEGQAKPTTVVAARMHQRAPAPTAPGFWGPPAAHPSLHGQRGCAGVVGRSSRFKTRASLRAGHAFANRAAVHAACQPHPPPQTPQTRPPPQSAAAAPPAWRPPVAWPSLRTCGSASAATGAAAVAVSCRLAGGRRGGAMR